MAADSVGTARARISHNPFYVLELAIEATRMDAERQAAKLLGMIELGVGTARRCASPLGDYERTSDDVRVAIAALRDPVRRLQAEVWAMASRGMHAVPVAEATVPTTPTWPDAMQRLGLEPRR